MSDNPIGDLIRQGVNAIGGLLNINNQKLSNLITVLRVPTPYKISRTVTADNNGAIGGGLSNPNPVELYQCPENHEAWLHRITITSPSAYPRTPLTTGQLLCTGTTSGEVIFFAPVSGTVAPLIITEGRASAAHLNGGERVAIVGDFLPAFVTIRLDLQLLLVTGISADTPKPNYTGVLD